MLDSEGISAEDAALSVLARQAAGSMRDAMSLLDQVIAWSNQELTGEAVARVLGVASRGMLLDLARAVIAGKADAALHLVDAVANQGFDIVHVTRDLLAVLRDAVVSAVSEHPEELIDLPPEEQQEVKELGSSGTDDLLRLHQAFAKGYEEVARSSTPRSALEMLLVKLCRRPPLVPIDDLIDRLSRLERRLAASGGAQGGGVQGGGGPRNPTGESPGDPRRSGVRSAPEARPSENPAPVARVAESRASTTAPSAHGAAERATPLPTAAAPSERAPSAHAVPTPSVPAQAVPPSQQPQRQQPQRQSVTPRATAPAEQREVAPEADADSPVERWRRVVDVLRAKDPKIGAFLDHAEVLNMSVERIHLGVEKESMFFSEVTSKATVQEIEAAASSIFGARPEVEFTAQAGRTEGVAQAETVFAKDKEARARKEREDIERARSHPVVVEAVRVFGARVKNIELPKNAG